MIRRFTKEEMQAKRKELESRLVCELEFWQQEHQATDAVQVEAITLNALAMLIAGVSCKNHSDLEPNLAILAKLHDQMQEEVKKLCATAQRARRLKQLYDQFNFRRS